MRFRKKPVVVDAVQYDSVASLQEIMQWSGARFLTITTKERDPDNPNEFVKVRELAINTLEGDMIVRPGDWIIRGVQGEFYPCRSDIFEQTYEVAE